MDVLDQEHSIHYKNHSPMKIIDIHHPDTFDLAIEAIHQSPIIVQLSTVFLLLAAPTLKGAVQLNEAKKILPL